MAMDYEVFLLARIKEFHDAGLGNDAAVVRGLQKVKSVVLWFVLVHNLFRWIALRAERAKAAA